MSPLTMWAVMQSTGIESEYASASAVAALVTPGPVVTRQTPGRPVDRAYPSAMKAAPCSWPAVMCSIPSAEPSAR